MKKILVIVFVWAELTTVNGQQFNSDSYLSKAWGTITLIPTIGRRSSMIMNTYSLFPKWEFTMAAYLYNNDNDPLTNDGYSASLYAKYMFYENREKTGGFAAKAGTGTRPGTLDAEFRVKDAFKTYWMNTPATIPFFKNTLSIDLMPGASATVNYGDSNSVAWAFTYSARVAWYPLGPKASLVGEVYGSAGATGAIPEYKAGLRWEPSQYAVFALTYGHEFSGSQGAGFEFGIMLFTPPFACIGGCQPKKGKGKKNL
ncbi:hypothetical protein A4D02_21930 [Niastella koreensis]|uniref:MetA-pathway of phenol degradation n=2 Tax=Niastella koreensis TaxID=354356 RepID=G8TGQ0_NIAKG|nr:hypothetical protein [Niastella koreensis]AEV98492.1 hypothetical protein Niako_2137 [Niastella koreensis GR20-10]OQP53064.1 hypothetical protein A4D02_21930 [Niastella koreensis]